MANARKRILELTALQSASLNTTLVGVDGGTTYKIELDTLADAVTARVNILDRDRLNSLESVTSSFETKGRNIVSGSSQLTSSYDQRYVISGSLTETNWDNINGKPNGLVSQSTDLSALNSFTSSQSILNTAFNNGISARLQTSSFNDFSASVNNRIIAATNEQSFNGLISGSSQLTSSYDTRYVLSGSIGAVPLGTISGSSQLTSSFDTRYTLSASFVSSSNVASIQTITSASYAVITPVSGTLYIIIG